MKKKDWDLFKKELNNLIDEILGLPEEDNRLEQWFERYRLNKGIVHYKELDKMVFEEMYGREPQKSEVLKIRYWRCGRHLPINREEMLRLADVLGVTEEEKHIMLTEILLEQGVAAKQNQKDFLNLLAKRYLAFIPEERKRELGIRGQKVDNYLRHIIYADIMDCLWNHEQERNWYRERHDYSRNFASECSRFFNTNEKISRSTMQRLLMIMLIPEINREVMDDALKCLGYAPLATHIKKRSGACADRMFLWILGQFDRYRTGSIENDIEIQKRMLCCLDEQVVQRLNDIKENASVVNKERTRKILQDLRIMKFRSFGKEMK